MVSDAQLRSLQRALAADPDNVSLLKTYVRSLERTIGVAGSSENYQPIPLEGPDDACLQCASMGPKHRHRCMYCGSYKLYVWSIDNAYRADPAWDYAGVNAEYSYPPDIESLNPDNISICLECKQIQGLLDVSSEELQHDMQRAIYSRMFEVLIDNENGAQDVRVWLDYAQKTWGSDLCQECNCAEQNQDWIARGGMCFACAVTKWQP